MPQRVRHNDAVWETTNAAFCCANLLVLSTTQARGRPGAGVVRRQAGADTNKQAACGDLRCDGVCLGSADVR
jgi:hypothetical protein